MSCPVEGNCLNAGSLCGSCIGMLGEDEWEGLELALHYHAINRTLKPHPYLVWKKKQRKGELKAKKAAKPYKAKKNLGQKARRNEDTTRRDIIHATRRSGALLGDGDSRIGEGRIGLDDKLQSTSRKQITLKVDQIDKAREQHCIVIVTNAEGRKFAVAELDYFVSAAREIADLL